MRIVASIWLSDRRSAAFDNLNLGQISYEKLVYRGKQYRREIPLQKKKFEGYLRGWFVEEIDKGVKVLCTGRNLRPT